jgi:hypothetical protein
MNVSTAGETYATFVSEAAAPAVVGLCRRRRACHIGDELRAAS